MELYNNDCFEILPTLEENSIDLFILDLPYSNKHFGRCTNASWDNTINLDQMWKEIKRIMESCVELIVPAVVDVALGKDFGQAT